jgi:hypothetical protein
MKFARWFTYLNIVIILGVVAYVYFTDAPKCANAQQCVQIPYFRAVGGDGYTHAVQDGSSDTWWHPYGVGPTNHTVLAPDDGRHWCFLSAYWISAPDGNSEGGSCSIYLDSGNYVLHASRVGSTALKCNAICLEW